MRILFFNRVFYPDEAATGQLLTELCESLTNDFKSDVTVITASTNHRRVCNHRSGNRQLPIRSEYYNDIRIVRAYSTGFSKVSFVGRIANYISYFFSASLAAFLAPHPDIIVSLTDPPIIGLTALVFSRLYGSKFVFLCQDIFPEVATLLEDFRSESVNKLLYWLNGLLLRKADCVVTIGETMKERIIKKRGIPSTKIVVIHNWADSQLIYPCSKDNRFSRQHGLVDKFVVMHSGNIGLSQGLEALIECARLLRDYQNIMFVFVGEGVKKQTLIKKTRAYGLSNVLFLPYQSREMLKYSFSSADAFIISLKEGLAGYIVPSKLYGILASGRPYVATIERDSEVAQITNRFSCGLLAEPGDPKDLAEKVLLLYRDRTLVKRLGANGRRAAGYFDRKIAVNSYYKLFTDLLGDQHSKHL